MDNIGGTMQEAKARAIKALAVFAGMLVYIGMIGYSAVHNWRLLTAGVAPDMILWAGVGVLAIEISALALPLALHYWTHAALQRFAAFAFYGLDLALIFLNVVLDYAIVGQAAPIPAWMQMYQFYALPATPVFAGLGWSLLFLLDPSQRERGMIETLRASTREVLAARIAEAAKSADVSESVELAAAQLARDVIGSTLGVSTSYRRPALPSPTPTENGHSKSPGAAILHWPKMRRGKVTYNATAGGGADRSPLSD